MRAMAREGEYVGEGCSREVFRIGDVVYKVETARGANVSEYHNANELRGYTPENIIVPDMTLYPVAGAFVLAMPYIDGKSVGECMAELGLDCDHTDCLSDNMHSILENLNFDATSYGNVIYSEGVYYMIDLGADNNHEQRISA